MEIIDFRTGFWASQDMKNPDFDFLYNVFTGRNSLMDYLHGYCTLFAIALWDIADCSMYCLTDEDIFMDKGCPNPADRKFPLVHDFCVFGDIRNVENPPLYVDCRGITNNRQAFLKEYEDFFTNPHLIRYTEDQIQELRQFLWSSSSGCDAEQYYLEALNFMKNHPHYYLP